MASTNVVEKLKRLPVLDFCISETDIQAYIESEYGAFASRLRYKTENKYKGLFGCLASIYAFTLHHKARYPMPICLDGYRVMVIKPLLMAFSNVWLETQTFTDIQCNMKTMKFFTCTNNPEHISNVVSVYHPPYSFYEKLVEYLPADTFELPNKKEHEQQHYRMRGRNKPCGCQVVPPTTVYVPEEVPEEVTEFDVLEQLLNTTQIYVTEEDIQLVSIGLGVTLFLDEAF